MIKITCEESAAINSLRLLCVICVVMIHSNVSSYDAVVASMDETSVSIINHWHTILCFPSGCLGLLFVLSGYLFFRGVGESFSWFNDYFLKIKSRILSLFVFWIVWCILHIACTFVLGGNKCDSALDFFSRFWPEFGEPVWGRGMWFIRSLIAFTILSPIYYIVVKIFKHLTVVLCLVLLWLDIPITFTYFNVYLLFGCYLSCMNITLTSLSEIFRWRVCLIGYVMLHIFSSFISSAFVQALCPILALVSLIGIFRLYPIPKSITQISTFLYAAHFYFVAILIKTLIRILPISLSGAVVIMVMGCVLNIILCFIAYRVINKVSVLNLILTGGR